MDNGTIKAEKEAEDNTKISLVPFSEIKNEPELLIHDTCEDSDSMDFSEEAYAQNVFEIKADIEDNESSGREFLTESESEFLTDSESEFPTEKTMTLYKSHAFQHEPYKKLICTICDEEFDTQLEIAKHLKADYNVDNYKKFNIIFTCPVCNIDLESHDAQMQHMNKEHQVNTTLKGVSMKEVYDEDGAEVKKVYECLECGAQLSNNYRPIYRLEHRMSHLPYKPYKCKLCEKSSCYLRNIGKHIVKCSKLKPASEDIYENTTKCQANLNIIFICPVCNVELQSKRAQMDHINKEHKVNTTTEGLSMKEIVLYDKKRAEIKIVYECLECGAQLRNKSGVCERLEHRMMHLPYKPYKCKRCGIMFSHHKSVERHSVKCNKLKTKWCPASEDIDDNTANINLMFICPVCNVELESRDVQIKHIDMEHQVNTTLKGLSMKEVVINDAKGTEVKKVYECLECGTQLKNNSYSQPIKPLQHRMSHLPYKPYKCKLCKKSLSGIYSFEKHLVKCKKLKPASEDIDKNKSKCRGNLNMMFICPVCNVELKSKDAQMQHINKEHQVNTTLKGLSMKEVIIYEQEGAKGKKVYECLKCDAQLRNSSRPFNRMEHRMSHLPYKPYKCKLCKKPQSYLDSLEKHLSKCKKLKPASEDIYENNIIYICPVCNVELDAFKAQRHHLNKEHQITLKELSMKEVVIYDQKGAEVKVYECLECDAQLSIKSGLYRRVDHVMSHLQYIPYKCKLCRISFFNLKSLREHLVQCKKNPKLVTALE